MKFLLPNFYFLLFTIFNSSAQPYSAYVNDKNHFYVLDGNYVKQIDYLAPYSYKIGSNCIAYIDNVKNFKVFYKGESVQLAEGYTDDYNVGTDLITINANRMLYIFDNGKVKLLAQICDRYIAGDSIIAFYDKQFYNFNYYWNGKIEKLEEGIGGDPIQSIVTGDNIIAYNNNFNNFKIVYQGEIIEQENKKALTMRAAANTVAYVDDNNTFKIFYKGETFEVSPFAPRNISIGDNIVAYTDNTNTFNIFYKGTTTEIGSYNPTYLNVRDNMVVFADGTGGLNVFYDGKTQRLENYIPVEIKISSNSIAYLDNSNRIQFFSFGKIVTMPLETTDGLELVY
ncbi:MAG: hypothetical protein LH629_08175, partial [Ignavibacteria bacterium]|nr:hypothetical protein [Ignavibacteria bacterium]